MVDENTKLIVKSVNISKQKGTIKEPVESIELTEKGIVNDAHAGKWHRQISLLGQESVDKFSVMAGREIASGEFAENITTTGAVLYEMKPLDVLANDDVVLEVTQIGKKCHGDSCAIYREVGNCVMPKEGIFTRVLKTGSIKPGDELVYTPKVYKCYVITLSDRASSGEYEDRSGPRIKELICEHFKKTGNRFEIISDIIPDSEAELKQKVDDATANGADFIFTTGGTGVGERDITPDVIQSMLDKEIPGIMELIRYKYGSQKPNALLSRGVAGIINKTQIYTLPGSVKAVNEYMEEILKTLDHLVLMLYGIDAH